MLAAYQSPAAIESAACTLRDVQIDVQDRLTDIQASFSNFTTQVATSVAQLDNIQTDLRCVESFVNSCPTSATEIGSNRDAIRNLIPDPSLPAFTDLNSAVDELQNICSQLNSAGSALSAADSAMDVAKEQMFLVSNVSDNVAEYAQSGSNLLDSNLDVVYSTVASLPDWVGIVAVFALFTFPVIVVFIALLVSPGTQSKGSAMRLCGVQCIGFSWVTGMFVAFLFCLLGAVLSSTAYIGMDAGMYVETLPQNLASRLNGTSICGSIPDEGAALDLNSPGNGAVCALAARTVKYCYTGENILEVLSTNLGFNLSVGSFRAQLTELETDFNSSSLDDFDETDQLSTELADLQSQIATTAASDLGVVGANAASLNTELDALRSNVAAFKSAAENTVSCASGLGSSAKSTVTSLVSLVNSILDAAVALGDCTWIPPLWTSLFGALQSVFAALQLVGLWGVLCVGISYIFYIPAAIVVQVRGGVGYEPGCPSFCRTSCCGCGPESWDVDPDDAGGRGERKKQPFEPVGTVTTV